MKKKIFLLSLICLFVFSACQKKDSNSTVDLINIVRDGATMPAYIYGNTASKVFIVVLSGGPGGGGLSYKISNYSDPLEKDYAMVYFDQRGQGMAQGTYGKKTLTVENMAKDVDLLADAIKYKYGEDISLFLMGHSWGGTLGSQVMIDADRQQKYKGWIEIDGAHDFPLMLNQGLEDMKQVADSLDNNDTGLYWTRLKTELDSLNSENIDFAFLNAKAFEVEEKLAEEGYIAPTELSNSFQDLKIQVFVNNPATTFLSHIVSNNHIVTDELLNYSLTNQLKNIQIPSLILWGKFDMVVSPSLGYSAFEEIGSSDKELHIFESSGHSPMITEPELFLTIFTDFIEKYR